MTIDRLHLAELIEKGSDADLLKEMMTYCVNRMMDLRRRDDSRLKNSLCFPDRRPADGFPVQPVKLACRLCG